MCFCDGKIFKVTNTATGDFKLYKRASNIAKRFDVYKDWVFSCIERGHPLSLNGDYHKIEINRHPECEQVRKQHNITLEKIPSCLRHLLPVHRQ